MHTFVYCLAASDLPELTPITIIIKLLPDFLVDLLFLEHILFLLDLPDDIRWFFITAKRALDHIIVLHLVFGPLTEALEMKSVSTNGMTGGSGVTLDDLHVANGTEKVLILVIFFDDHIFPEHLDLGVLQKLLHLVIMNPSIGYNISQLLIIVNMAK